jgi:Flp pilus assembly protein TadD
MFMRSRSDLHAEGNNARLTSRLSTVMFSSTILAFLVFCTSSTSVLAQSGARFGLEIDVQLRMANGHPGPRGVHITMESAEGGTEGDCQTSEGGKCELRPTSAGVYIVRLREPGYKEMSARVELTAITRQFVTLELQPSDRGSQPRTTAPANSGSVSAAELNMPPKALAEFQKGQKAMEQKKMDEAISHLRKSVSQYDASPQSHLLLGSAYLEKQDWKQAQASLEKVIQLDPNLSDAYLELGAVYNQTKDYPKAETALTKGLQLSPDAAGGHYELAKTYWAMNRWQDAAPHASQAVATLPNLAPPHVLLGNIFLRRNDPQRALHEYQEYLRLDPNGSMAAGTREMVAKIEKSLSKK